MARAAGAAIRARVWTPAQVGRIVQGAWGFCRHLMFDESARHEDSPEKDPAVEYPLWQHAKTAEAQAANGVQLEYVELPRDMVLAEWDIKREDGNLDLIQEGTPPDALACKWLSLEGADTTQGSNLWHQLGGEATGDPEPAGSTSDPDIHGGNDTSFRSRFALPKNAAWSFTEARTFGLGSDFSNGPAGDQLLG